MIQQINSGEFMQAFHRFDRYAQFGYEALTALYEYFEEVNPEMELDVIAICCDYSHDSAEDIAQDYNIDLTDCEDDEEKAEKVREWLNENTSIVGETSSGFVYCTAF
jgi:hypothetical protein